MLWATPAASEPSVRNFCSRIRRKRSSCSRLTSRKTPMRCTWPPPSAAVDRLTSTGRGSPAPVISRTSPCQVAPRICAVSAGTSWEEVASSSVHGRPRRASTGTPTISANARLAKMTVPSASVTSTPSPILRTTSASSRVSACSRACTIVAAMRSATMRSNRSVRGSRRRERRATSSTPIGVPPTMSGATISERKPPSRMAGLTTRGSAEAPSGMMTGTCVASAIEATPASAGIDTRLRSPPRPAAARPRSSLCASSSSRIAAASALNTPVASSTILPSSASASPAPSAASAISSSAWISAVRRVSSRPVTSVRVRATSSSGRNGLVM